MKWLLLLLLFAPTRASAQKFVKADELASFDGVTICVGNRLHSFVRLGLSPAEEQGVAAHEAKHREQAGRFNNDCARWTAYYKTPVGKLAAEAEAYMAQLCVMVGLGADPLSIRQDYARRIARYFGGDVNALAIRAAMRYYDTCPITASDIVDTTRTVMPGWQ